MTASADDTPAPGAETAPDRATRRAPATRAMEHGTRGAPEESVERPQRSREDATHIEGTEGGEAVTVKFDEEDKPKPVRTQAGELTLPPTTTAQEDIVTGEQRLISRLWEISQSLISVLITISVIYCQIAGIQSETLNNAFFFVIATYLQRTNHTRVGGRGQRVEDGVYRGR